MDQGQKLYAVINTQCVVVNKVVCECLLIIYYFNTYYILCNYLSDDTFFAKDYFSFFFERISCSNWVTQFVYAIPQKMPNGDTLRNVLSDT